MRVLRLWLGKYLQSAVVIVLLTFQKHKYRSDSSEEREGEVRAKRDLMWRSWDCQEAQNGGESSEFWPRKEQAERESHVAEWRDESGSERSGGRVSRILVRGANSQDIRRRVQSAVRGVRGRERRVETAAGDGEQLAAAAGSAELERHKLAEQRRGGGLSLPLLVGGNYPTLPSFQERVFGVLPREYGGVGDRRLQDPHPPRLDQVCGSARRVRLANPYSSNGMSSSFIACCRHRSSQESTVVAILGPAFPPRVSRSRFVLSRL